MVTRQLLMFVGVCVCVERGWGGGTLFSRCPCWFLSGGYLISSAY